MATRQNLKKRIERGLGTKNDNAVRGGSWESQKED